MAQQSIILELQLLASTSGTSAVELLRKALLVATKLDTKPFRSWVEWELKGYADAPDDELPPYRRVITEMRYQNPYHGWQQLRFDNSKAEALFNSVVIRNPIAEIEEMAKPSEGFVTMPVPAEMLKYLVQQIPLLEEMPVTRFVASNRVHGMVDAVRTVVLEWALKLESEGILGDGMTFSDDEKKKATASQIFNIGQLTGNIGDITGHNIQIGDYGSIHEQLKSAGVPQAERNELENIMDALKNAKPEDKPTWRQKGLDWLGNNASNLGSIASGLLQIFSHPK